MTPDAALIIISLYVKHCPGCGYDISAHGRLTCPECGRNMTPEAFNWKAAAAKAVRRRKLQILAASLAPNLVVLGFLLIDGRAHPTKLTLGIAAPSLMSIISAAAAGVCLLLFLTRRKHRLWTSVTTLVLLAASWLWPVFVLILYSML